MKSLVVRFSSLGDIILTTPVVESLAAAFPQGEIHFAAATNFASIINYFPHPVTLRPFAGRERSEFITYLDDFAGERFDLVVDLHANWRSRMLRQQINAERVVSYPKAFWPRWKMVWLKQGLDKEQNSVDRYLATLEAAEIPVATTIPRLRLTAERRKTAAAELFRQGWPVGRVTIGLGWGARWPTKRVPVELWEKLMAQLSTRNDPAYIIFAEEEDRPAIEEFISRREGIDVYIFCGKPLDLVLGAVSLCNVFVSSDSGLMHAAAALGVPTLGIFGPTHPALGFGPRGIDAQAVHAGLFCSPCSRHGKAACYRGEQHCFKRIDTMKLADQVAGYLEQGVRS